MKKIGYYIIGTLLLVALIILNIAAFGSNVQVVLDSNDGSSGLVIKNKNLTNVATIDSTGNSVSKSLKLAASSAPAPDEGTLYFDSAEKRIRYSDGLQWIQVDPAYTTKEVKYANASLGETGYVAFFTTTTDIIITSMRVRSYNSAPDASMFWTVSLRSGGESGQQIAYNSGSHYHLNIYGERYQYFDLVFPIPIKVSSGQEVGVYGTQTSGASYDLGINIWYIELPL